MKGRRVSHDLNPLGFAPEMVGIASPPIDDFSALMGQELMVIAVEVKAEEPDWGIEVKRWDVVLQIQQSSHILAMMGDTGRVADFPLELSLLRNGPLWRPGHGQMPLIPEEAV